MNCTETIFLGIVQGVTEFLPISSSGHLVIFQNLLGFKEPELLLDCSLHLGTLLAVCLYLRADLKQMAVEIWQGDLRGPRASLAGAILLGTLPTALMGIAFRTHFERLYQSVATVGMMLLATGLILILTGVVLAATKMLSPQYGRLKRVGPLVALAVGTAQGLAIIPGISRSGATIVVGLLCGLDRDLAGRFSFLLAIPAIVGAVILQSSSEALTRVGWGPLLLGFGSSALVGFAALKVLMSMVRKGQLHYFAPYCWGVGVLAILLV
jgi:undecaprenyl-diphosphatase